MPCKATIFNLVNKFRKTGSVSNVPHGRKPVDSTKIAAIENCFNADHSTSTTKVAQQVGLAPSTVWNVARNQLKVFSYKYTNCHQLADHDAIARHTYCNWLLNKVDEDGDFFENCFWSDEAWFTLNTGPAQIHMSSGKDPCILKKLVSGLL